jgi:hypothetical protein
MNSKYGNFVFENLSKSKKTSLKILLEEDEEKSKSKEKKDETEPDEEENKDEDPFGDLNFGDDDEGDDNKGDDDKGSEGEESDDDNPKKQDTAEIDQENLNNLSDQVSYMKNFFEKIKKNDGTSSVENYISSAVSSSLNASSLDLIEKFLRKNNLLSSILIEKKEEELDTVEAEIDDLDRVLSKGSEIVDKFKKGKDIDVQTYVDAAVNAFKNFDSLFAKELIVKQATINVLILNSGAKAEANIAEFEELFHEELNKQFNIEYDEYALITKQSKTAVGAKSSS